MLEPGPPGTLLRYCNELYSKNDLFEISLVLLLHNYIKQNNTILIY